MLTVPKVINSTTGKYYEENPNWDYGTDSNYYLYKNKYDNNDKEIDDAHTIAFGINNQFNYSKTNNVIYCEIEYDGVTYKGSYLFHFGIQSTSGTGYSFNIYPDSNDGLLLGGSANNLSFTAILENGDGEKIDLPDINNPITWSLLYDKHQEINVLNLSFNLFPI